MPFLLIYSASDFVGGVPAEAGAAAAGSGEFELTLRLDANPTVIEVSDNDAVFNEIDGGQTVAQDVVIDGQTIAAGTTISTAYDLINSESGHQVTSFHLGGNGYQQGAVDGIVSTVKLTPGETYTFDRERTSYRQDNQYDEFVACFVEGMQIDTPEGPRRVEDLRRGDLVVTLDHGAQPLRWVGGRTMSGRGALAPVWFAAGVLGNHAPLALSPDHRVLLEGPRIEMLFGQHEVLVPAKALVDDHHVTRRPVQEVRYAHLLLDRHELLCAQGAVTESLLMSDLALLGTADMGKAQDPGIAATGVVHAGTARPCLKAWEAAVLVPEGV